MHESLIFKFQVTYEWKKTDAPFIRNLSLIVIKIEIQARYVEVYQARCEKWESVEQAITSHPIFLNSSTLNS